MTMLCLPFRFGKQEKRRCGADETSDSRAVIPGARKSARTMGCNWPHRSMPSATLRAARCHRPGMTNEPLTSRPQFQAFETCGDVDPHLALDAEGLKRDRIGGAAD